MKDLVNFFFEVGTLKRTDRTGWSISGISKPDNVASHIYRTIVIGYVIAELEKCDRDKVVRMILFHDIPEARIGDLHKVAQNYIDMEEGEMKAAKDQSSLLPENIAKEYIELLKEFNSKETKESIVAKDADYLEAALSAKEHMINGYRHAAEFIERVRSIIRTDSAKKILDEIEHSDGFWWEGLKKMG